MDLRRQAIQAHRQGHLQEAEKLYRELVAATPEDAELLHLLGAVLVQQNQLETAQDFLEKAVNLEKNPVYYNSLANLCIRTQQFAEAEALIQQALALAPDYAGAYNTLGNIALHQNRFQDAKNAYENALQLQPEFQNARYNLATCEAHLGHLDAAKKQFEAILRVQPAHAPAMGQLAQLAMGRNDLEEAAVWLQKRLNLDPQNPDSLHDYGKLLLEQKEWEKAGEYLQRCLEIDPTQSELHYHLATALLQQSHFKKALEHYLQQLLQGPHAPSAYNAGVILLMQNHHKEALPYFQQALEWDPENPAIHRNLGTLYLKLNQRDEAKTHYERALHLQGHDPELAHILAGLSQEHTPAAAPKEYLQALFDQYAPYYDVHLGQQLQYSVPAQCLQTLQHELPNQFHPGIGWTLVDLGCGSGLCGPLFRPYAKRLVGIDISSAMLDVARAKQCYDELLLGDIVDKLDQMQNVDLLIAADVFTYIGDLEPLFNKVRGVIRNRGYFIFSVEPCFEKPYQLLPSIRYAHRKDYIETLCAAHQFNVVSFQNIILRQQYGKPLEGYLFLIEKINA